MKTISLLVALSFVTMPFLAFGATIDDFKGGAPEAVADLSASGHTTVVNISVPADCYALKATMNVTGVPVQGEYPRAPEVLLNNTRLWAFNGTGVGSFGGQDQFADGTNRTRLQYGVPGGTRSTAIRLPSEAVVQNATLTVNVTGPMNVTRVLNLTGYEQGECLGGSVSNAGDVNDDGYDDVIVGAWGNSSSGYGTGRASIYLGGPSMDSVADLNIFGTGFYDYLGISVSGAGDVNNDSYDDVIVGAFEAYDGGTGYACIYFGGPSMDGTPDVTLYGESGYDNFSISVSAAGDVNGDGYDDVMVGADGNDAGGDEAGRAYIYFGGSSMNNAADVVLSGARAHDHFGMSVSTAGDLNGDSYDDVIVGAPCNFLGASDMGSAFIYFGGSSMDSTADLNLSGTAKYDQFGVSVSDAGDVNNDGYDDAIVGADEYYLPGPGHAYLYLGGPAMDNASDVTFAGPAVWDIYGISVSSAGDVNNDGYDDMIVGADESNQIGLGRAFLYIGGPAMFNISDSNLTGAALYDLFGHSVSSAGDVNNDGCDEVIVGAYGNDAGINWGGRAFVYTYSSNTPGVLNPNITVGSSLVWNMTGYFNGTNITSDFSDALNSYLRAASPSGNDSYGNYYVDIPVNISAKSVGKIGLYNLDIEYECNATVPDFAAPLNAYISAHKSEMDANGNITVPIKVHSRSAGNLKLFNLNITYDGAPELSQPIPPVEMSEDTCNRTLLWFWDYFEDEYTPDFKLNFSIVNATNPGIVNVSINAGSYLSADALTGAANDNWTGTVSLRVRCTDTRGYCVLSNSFDISVMNVNDPPLITSTPPTDATKRYEYAYQCTAEDVDNDTLAFSLPVKPENMTISTTGMVSWTPSQVGDYDVSIAVSDGNATDCQNFSINVTSNETIPENHLPVFTSVPITTATVGVQYNYHASAVDMDNDSLTFSLSTPWAGMGLNSTTGVVTWTPSLAGTYNVSIAVSDGKGNVFQNFSIAVTGGAIDNNNPYFTSLPVTDATVGVQYIYKALANDVDSDTLAFGLLNKSEGMSIDPTTGRINWTPSTSQVGNHTVTVGVSDGRGGVAAQTFVIRVWDSQGPPAKPECTITSHLNGTTVSKKIILTGSVKKGTSAISTVQIRVDSGVWSTAVGRENWTYELDTKSLKNGQHTVYVRASDGASYSDASSVILNVDNPATNVTSEPFPLWMLAVVAVIGCVGGGLAFMMVRRKNMNPTSKTPEVAREGLAPPPEKKQ